MKITIDANKQIPFWAFLHVVSTKENKDQFDKVMADRTPGAQEFDIVLTVDGQEFNFESLMIEYSKQIDKDIEERAVELVQEKFQKLHDQLFNISNTLLDAETKISKELAVHLPEGSGH